MNINKIIREELIKEVGSIDRTYPWEGPIEQDFMGNVAYFFTSDKHSHYIIKFDRFPDGEWERNFTADGKYMQTDEGDVYRVMATITEITLDFIDQYEPNKVEISHIDTEKEMRGTVNDIKNQSVLDFINNKSKISNKRAKLNQIYLSNNIPTGYTYQLKGSRSVIKKIKNE